MAAITTETSVEPSAPATFTETRSAPGATPRHLPAEAAAVAGDHAREVGAVAELVVPGVPARREVHARDDAVAEVLVSAPRPVSIIATVTPLPSIPSGS